MQVFKKIRYIYTFAITTKLIIILEYIHRCLNLMEIPKICMKIIYSYCMHSFLSFKYGMLIKYNLLHTSNEGPVRIEYKCLVPIYVFPERKLLFLKQNYNAQSPSSHTHISVRDFCISRIDLPILLQGNMWTNLGNV
jgi:hypothetical protein